MDFVLNIIQLISYNYQLKLIVSLAIGFIFLETIVFYRIFLANIIQRDKIITFDNPSGRVTVSLFAIEDLVKRTIARMHEIKQAKTSINVSRKGLKMKIRLVLNAEVSIPEVTSKVQDLVKQKIQSTIGSDEPIEVSIFVDKIIAVKVKEQSEEVKQEVEENAPGIPFQGYRA